MNPEIKLAILEQNKNVIFIDLEASSLSPSDRIPLVETKLIQRLSIAEKQNKLLNKLTHFEGTIKKQPRIARNAICPCGSGKKLKKCCGSAKNNPIQYTGIGDDIVEQSVETLSGGIINDSEIQDQNVPEDGPLVVPGVAEVE